MSGRTSGVQREVTHLYRRVLRAARLKDSESNSMSTSDLVKAEFREKVSVNYTSRSCDDAEYYIFESVNDIQAHDL